MVQDSVILSLGELLVVYGELFKLEEGTPDYP